MSEKFEELLGWYFMTKHYYNEEEIANARAAVTRADYSEKVER